MKVLSLFSGIGGLDLAAEWAGMETVAFCEIDDYACKVLEKRWPNVPIYRDVRELTAEQLKTGGIDGIDLLCGGFPCQPFSQAGKRNGQEDERYLWPEMLRLMGELRPRWVLGENVAGLLSIADVSGRAGGTFGTILYDLASMGYRVGWGCYGAGDVGFYHQRNRVFILAYSPSIGRNCMEKDKLKRRADVHLQYFPTRGVAEANLYASIPWTFTNPKRGVLRNDDGFSEGMDRLRCLGNAVMPQQAYPIFKAIMEVERCQTA